MRHIFLSQYFITHILSRVFNENEAWRPIQTKKSLEVYASELTRFLACILRTLSSGLGYQFSLSSAQKEAAQALWMKLDGSDNILSLLHTLIYSLIGQPITGADTNQWLCPLTCWLAISSLRSDSKFRAAVDYTPVLAHWQYHIRNTHLHQAQIFIDNYEDGLIGYVSTFYLYFHLSHVLFFRAVKFQCATYLNEELVSPWNTVRWHQHYASNIVYSEAAPPCITWSPDMSKVDCQGRTLEIAHLRLGLQNLLQGVEQRMDTLCGSIEELDIPSDLTEDFTDDRMGWSWLDMQEFTKEPLPLLKHILSKTTDPVATVDSFGQLQWLPHRLSTYRQLFDEINRDLSILSFILPAPSPRGAEFMDMRIRNSQIPRNLYKNFGTWFVHRLVKTTTLVGKLSWVPVLCPDRLARLVDRYLLLVRPVESLFTGILSGSESRALYEEFMWVQGGERVTSLKFSRTLGQITRQYMDCELTLQPWRHIMVSIMREFIPPRFGGNNIGDLLSNHSTQLAQKTYAREVDQLPFLTTDILLDSREICTVWHDILGCGAHTPPIPMRLLSYNTSPPSLPASSSITPSSVINLDAQVGQILETLKSHIQIENKRLQVENKRDIEDAVVSGISTYMVQSGLSGLAAEMKKLTSLVTKLSQTGIPGASTYSSSSASHGPNPLSSVQPFIQQPITHLPAPSAMSRNIPHSFSPLRHLSRHSSSPQPQMSAPSTPSPLHASITLYPSPHTKEINMLQMEHEAQGHSMVIDEVEEEPGML